MEDKLAPYLRPLYDALSDRLSMKRVRALMAEGAIEIAPVGFMRGRTLNNAFVVIDEAQNCTYVQLKMLLTRLGWHSTMVVTGDPNQSDLLPELSGLGRRGREAGSRRQHRRRPPGRPRHRPPPAGGQMLGVLAAADSTDHPSARPRDPAGNFFFAWGIISPSPMRSGWRPAFAVGRRTSDTRSFRYLSVRKAAAD